jgi:hypothetical protein
LLEAGFYTVMTAPAFTRQIKGRPKTDRLDCQWIQRLHKHGLLPPIFQPDEPTQTLRDYVRQRANLVRLSGQHIQRMQKALELMNLKLTTVLGDVTGVTGLKIIRAIVAGERDPIVLAKLRDRRCKHPEAAIAEALDGRYRPEHVTELTCCLKLWETYQEVIAELDTVIAGQLRSMRRTSELPRLAAKPRVRGKKPHDPTFDVREALYYLLGVDLTAIEGIDELHALTLVSELGTDFTKWPSVKQFASWLGLFAVQADGREGEVEPHAEGTEPSGSSVSVGGVEPAAEQGIFGGVFASSAIAVGGSEGDHGDGSQAGADRVSPGAVRGGVREEGRGGVCRAGAGAIGEAAASPRKGVGLRGGEDGRAGRDRR